MSANSGRAWTVRSMDVGRDRRALLDANRLMVHPTSARVVLEGLRHSADSGPDITRVIMTDPALSASVMRAANAAHLGYSRRIGGIRQASVMLGGQLVGSLAAGRVADLIFDTAAPDYPDWLWLHSLAVACSSSVIARHVGESVDEAFTAGLLHDIGWLLASSNGVGDPDIDHAGAGAALLARWNLPDRIVSAVQQHHTRPGGLTAPLDRIVGAAHAYAAALGAPTSERSMTTAEATQLVNLGDVRQAALLGEIEAELTTLTSELTS